MKTLLNWKKGPFSSTYQIYSGEELIGELADKAFKKTSEGRIGQKHYKFRTKGVFKQETQIMDGENDLVIGTISYQSMKSKATIQLRDRVINWKYDNGRQTKWSLHDDQGTLMKFAGGFSKGSIECDEIDELLLLAGIFVTNYFQQAMIVI
jgi:hypothetical protein